MFNPVVSFASTGGLILSRWRALLTPDHAGITVQAKKPSPMTARVVTLRNDGGLAERQTFRSQGVNVWAPTLDEALLIAQACAQDARSLPGVSPITAADSFTDPIEIDDDPPMTVVLAGKTVSLAHVYFTFRIRVRAIRP